MKFSPKRNRLVTKLQISCHSCKTVCSPKNGDWHNGEQNQIFLCQECGKFISNSKPKYQSILGSVGNAAIASNAKPKPLYPR